jgi:hypothetical protein
LWPVAVIDKPGRAAYTTPMDTKNRKNFRDLSNRRFGRLRVTGYAGVISRRSAWHCRCRCGKTVIVAAAELPRRKSCGCGSRRAAAEFGKRTTTHGMSRSPEYHAWVAMIQRCENPKCRSYKNYGGRGIAVCRAWHSFATFSRDMGPRPAGKYTIERRKNHLGYSPSNCLWATRAAQSRNKRDNHLVTCRGETLTVKDWSDRTGLHFSTISYRLAAGWPAEAALFMPAVRGRNQHLKGQDLLRQTSH